MAGTNNQTLTLMYYDDYDDNHDIYQLQQLPQFKGLTEKELRHIVAKINLMERQQWEADVKEMLRSQRQKALAHIEEHAKDKTLPPEEVQIDVGLLLYPVILDDRGFITQKMLQYQKPTLKFSLDSKRKIYVKKID